jgi:3-oxoacyl-[acyl-carrier protein] reductase
MRVVISGGSRGLGAEIATYLLEEGHQVATFARTETETVGALRDGFSKTYLFETVDVTDEGALKAFVDSVVARWGEVDALINNAAIGQDSLLAHTPPSRIADIVNINLIGMISLTRLVIRQMLRQDSLGKIINIGSISSSQGYAGLSVYAATKGAVDAFTRCMARELQGRIHINTISPGFFESEMSDVLLPEQKEAIVRRTPTGRLTEPQQLIQVVELLLSKDSNINGAVIPVDGGATA